MSSEGFTGAEGRYEPAGIVHKGEYVVPSPYDYPKWWTRIRKFVWPKALRRVINKKVRTYNPEKDFFLRLTGKRAFED